MIRLILDNIPVRCDNYLKSDCEHVSEILILLSSKVDMMILSPPQSGNNSC